jgi:hypothetical protein
MQDEVNCPECNHPVPIPRATSVRAAVAVLDRSGHGPRSTLVHADEDTDTAQLQEIISELKDLPYPQRFILCRETLPEHSDVFDALERSLPLSDMGLEGKTLTDQAGTH